MLDHVISGSVYESQGDYYQALHEYNQALLYDQAGPEVYLAASEMYDNVGEKESALKVLEEGLESYPEHTGLARRRAEILLDLQRLDKALTAFRAIVDEHPEDRESWTWLARILEHSGRSRAAAHALEHVAELTPESEVEIRRHQARLYSAAGEYERAEEIYRRLEKLNPEDHTIPFFLGGMHLERGDTLQALDAFGRAAEANPKVSQYWGLQVRLNLVLDREERALALLDSALSEVPGSLDLLRLAGALYSRSGREDDAERVLLRAVEVDSSDVEHLINLGFLYHNQERWEKAEWAYEEALAEEPGNPQLLNNYAYMLAEADRRLEDAEAMINRALEEEPDNPSFLDTKGWLLFRKGEHEDALDFIQRALELDPGSPEILEHLGDIQAELGNREKARKAWEKAIEAGGEEEPLRKKLNSAS